MRKSSVGHCIIGSLLATQERLQGMDDSYHMGARARPARLRRIGMEAGCQTAFASKSRRFVVALLVKSPLTLDRSAQFRVRQLCPLGTHGIPGPEGPLMVR